MRTRLPWLVGAVIVAMWGCNRPAHNRAAWNEVATQADAPVVVVVFDGGMPADPTARSSGIRLAVWDDGTALVAADPLHPDRDMRVGRLAPEQLRSALGELDRSGFLSRPPVVLVMPDSSHLRVTARSGVTTRTHDLDSYHQSQEEWWPAVAAALERLRPTEVRPVAEAAEDGRFRGYVVAEWWRTPWAR